MKKTLPILLILLFFMPYYIFGQRGRVQIKDGTIVTDQGTLLRGLRWSTEGNNSLPDKEDISNIKKIGLNCIHLYAENPQNSYAGVHYAYIDSMVSWTKQESLYLIMTIGGGTKYNGGFDSTFVHDFWEFYAPRYKDETHVIYEIDNESYAWSSPYDDETLNMERWAYKLIRENAPDTHILLMSYALAKNEDSIVKECNEISDVVDWSNASIASHGYETISESLRQYIRTINDGGFAITFTEPQEIENTYLNKGSLRVFEEEFVSSTRFIPINTAYTDSSLFIKRVEQTEIRWEPDFGTWPLSIDSISYITPYDTILAADCDEGAGLLTGGTGLTTVSTNDYVAYYYMNFESGSKKLYLTYTCPSDNGYIELHLDSKDGDIIEKCELENTGSWSTETTTAYDVNITGKHNLYLVFKNDNTSSDFVYFKSFKFLSEADNPCSYYSVTGETTGTPSDLNDGEIILTVVGGTEPIKYLWTDGITTKDRTNLTTGNYAVTVTDDNECIENLSFTIDSISYVNPYDIIYAGYLDEGYGYTITGNYLTNMKTDEWVGYKYLKFETGSDSVSLNYSCPVDNGYIELHLDSIDGEIIKTLAIENTGSWTTLKTTSYAVNISGTHNIYLALVNNSTTSNFIFFRYFQFHKGNFCDDFKVSGDVTTNISDPNKGNITLTVNGGREPYSYLWSDNSTDKDRTDLAAGTYSVQVMDSIGCIVNDTFTIDFTNGIEKTTNNGIVIYSSDQTVYVMVNETWLDSNNRFIYVYNAAGKLIQKKVFNSLETHFNLPDKGVYLVKVVSGSMVYTKKVLGLYP